MPAKDFGRGLITMFRPVQVESSYYFWANIGTIVQCVQFAMEDIHDAGAEMSLFRNYYMRRVHSLKATAKED